MNKKKRIAVLEMEMVFIKFRLQQLENLIDSRTAAIEKIENYSSSNYLEIKRIDSKIDAICDALQDAQFNQKITLLLNHLGLEFKIIPEQPERIEIVKKDKHAKQKKS